MAAETLAPAGFRGGITWPGVDVGHEGRGVTGAPVSMTLTSTLLRRRTSRRNPRIPTIPAGGFRGEAADVSAVDTWLLVGSTPRGVGATPAPARVGLLHEGGDLLAKGCAYCTNPRPTWSTPGPLSVAPDPRAVHARHHPSNCETRLGHRADQTCSVLWGVLGRAGGAQAEELRRVLHLGEALPR